MATRRAGRAVAAGAALVISLVLSACGGGPSTAPPATSRRSPPATTIGATQITGPVQGAALVHTLREGGLLLWMRHTERDNQSGTVTPEQAASHDCAAQSELTPTGRQHAEQIGAAIRALHLPIAAVHTGDCAAPTPPDSC